MNYSTDPTFLRTIVDGLSSGALQKDNPSALPEGLVGLYEEAIPQASQVNERKKFLGFFGVWALMKKEVSAEFVVSLLDGWSEEEVLAYIGRYSKWFNSPASGLYTLYHERFRAFVFQKISGSQLLEINSRVIKSCNDALNRQLKDEWERYALEFLSAHLLMPSLENNNRSNELKELAYSTTYWNRQIEVSKGFDWSKRLLNDMMLWASKYDDDQVIECALNKVDLHHMEQNDAPRIVELVAQNDIETALQRIESFGGNDKEGLQRKFILYMLCLMELTLLESKDQSFRKVAIEKLLKHLDDNLPVDHSVLNWNDFFPSYLMFQMGFIIENYKINTDLIFKRGDRDNWYKYLNQLTGNLIRNRIEIDLNIIENKIIDNDWKRLWFMLVSKEYFQKSDYEKASIYSNKAIEIANNLVDLIDANIRNPIKSRSLKYISIELAKQRKVAEAIILSNSIIDLLERLEANLQISVILFDLDIIEESEKLLEQSLDLAVRLTEEWTKKSIIISILKESIRQGNFSRSLEIAKQISTDVQAICYAEISSENFYRGNFTTADRYLDIALNVAINIGDAKERSNVFKSIIGISIEQNQFEKAKSISHNYLDTNDKIHSLIKIARSMCDKEIFLDAKNVLESCNALFKEIKDGYNKNMIKKSLAEAFAFQGDLKTALSIAGDNFDTIKKIAFKVISRRSFDLGVEILNKSLQILRKSAVPIEVIKNLELEFVRDWPYSNFNIELINYFNKYVLDHLNYFTNNYYQTQIDENLSQLVDCSISLGNINLSLLFTKNISDKTMYNSKMEYLTIRTARLNFFEEAIEIANNLADEIDANIRNPIKSRALKYISIELTNQRKASEAIIISNSIMDLAERVEAIIKISGILFDFDIKEESEKLLNQSLGLAFELAEESNRKSFLISILKEIIRQGNFSRSLEIANNLNIDDQAICYAAISKMYFNRGDSAKAERYLDIAVNVAVNMVEAKERSNVFKEIIGISIEQHQFDMAKSISQNYLDTNDKIYSLIKIARSMCDKEIFLDAKNVLNSCNALIKELKDGYNKNMIKKSLAEEFAFQGDLKTALSIAGNSYDTIKEIAFEMAKKGNWKLAESTSMKIAEISERHECWKGIAKEVSKEKGNKNALHKLNQFQNPEAKKYFLKGLADSFKIIDADKELILNVRGYYQDDIESMQKLLQQHALFELFFSNSNKDKIERFNRTLNIQWAMDVRNN